ncbi:MAG: type I restriction enzyme HsdR N-terminal domain-containing protein [Flavobacteriales bacterium]
MKDLLSKLNLPRAPLVLSEHDGILKVKCLVRKKLIILTPEEWVRQHFIHYLNLELGYPLSLMKVEKQLKVNDLIKRVDIACVTSKGDMKLVVECKSVHVALDASVFDQAARYNMALKVPYLCITNGLNHFCAEVSDGAESINYLKHIPDYASVNA